MRYSLRPDGPAGVLAVSAVLAIPAVLAGAPGCSGVRDPPVEKAADQAAPLDSIVAEGQRLYRASEYQAARQVWLAALEHARTAQNVAVQAHVLTNLALAARQLGDFASARRESEDAVALELRHGLSALLPRSYNTLGLLAWDQGQLTEAVRLFQQTVAAAEAVGDTLYVHRPAGNLGTVYTQFGEYATARRYLLKAIDGARRHQDLRTQGRVLTNLAVLELRTGDPQAALKWLDQARGMAEAAGDAENEEIILAQLSDAYAMLGEPQRAFIVLDSALRQARAQRRPQAEAANLELQAGLYRLAGDLRRALDSYSQARFVNAALGLEEETGRDRRNEAEIHFALGNPELAERYAAEALEIHRRIGARPAELADLTVLVELAEARAQRELADHRLAEARKLVRAMDARSLRVDVALAESRILDRREDARGVLRVLDAIAGDLLLVGYTVEWEAHALRARAYARLKQLEPAAAAGRRAIVAIERIRAGFGSGLLRTAYVTDKRSAYSDLVGVLLQLGRRAEAFEVADAARSPALLEYQSRTDQVAPSTAAERETLLRRIEGIAQAIREAEASGSAAEAAELTSKLSAARREFDEFWVSAVERATPASASLPAGARAEADAVRAALLPGEAVVEYLTAPDHLFVFVITAAGLHSFDQPLPVSLDSRVRLARDLTADARTAPEQAHAVFTALHDLLVGDARRAGLLRDVTRVLLIPHGSLTYLPFGALRDPSSGRYLIEDFALLHVPSATVLTALRAARAATAAPVAGLTDGEVFAAFPRDLPASRAEARAVSQALRRAQLRLGRQATEASLREALARGGLVHVASHGVMNATSPSFSRIELSRPDDPTPDNDGRLEVHEVLGLSIRSPLVFLSGCETGVGPAWSTAFNQGEDYATLARAFLYAGARNVIATLWPVVDEGAAEFAQRFYEGLAQASPAEALVTAQRGMIAGTRYRHPYYWAGYRVAGDGLPSPGAQNLTDVSVR